MKKFVNLSGGLGNQLFQYAFGLNLGKVTGCEVKYCVDYVDDYKYGNPHSSKLSDAINIPAKKIARKSEIQAEFGVFFTPWMRRAASKFPILRSHDSYYEDNFIDYSHTPSVSDLIKYKYWHGIWQNSENFINIEKELKSLEFNDTFLPDYKKIEKSILFNNSVFLHIRRGDYNTNPKAKNLLGALNEEYYKSAIRKIEQTIASPKFYVFSDDVFYAQTFSKNNLDNYVVVEDWSENLAHLHMALMSKCGSCIISNSTFSWWGAFLGKEKLNVIYPMPWYLEEKMRHVDISEKKWVGICRDT